MVDQSQPVMTKTQTSTSTGQPLEPGLMSPGSGNDAETAQHGNKQSASNASQLISTLTASAARTGGDQATMFASVMTTTATAQSSSLQLSTAPVMQSSIAEPFGGPNWSQGFGRQVMMMVNQNIQSAELRMNPAHLGPVEVRIDMDDDQVSVAFTSRHAVVREAMESALPRLREMLDEHGLGLADTDISQQSFSEQHAASDGSNGDALLQNAEEDEPAGSNMTSSVSSVATSASIDSLVDYYI